MCQCGNVKNCQEWGDARVREFDLTCLFNNRPRAAGVPGGMPHGPAIRPARIPTGGVSPPAIPAAGNPPPLTVSIGGNFKFSGGNSP